MSKSPLPSSLRGPQRNGIASLSYREVGRILSISPARVRQIEQRAFIKLRRGLEDYLKSNSESILPE